jgi:hypothetical protein
MKVKNCILCTSYGYKHTHIRIHIQHITPTLYTCYVLFNDKHVSVLQHHHQFLLTYYVGLKSHTASTINVAKCTSDNPLNPSRKGSSNATAIFDCNNQRSQLWKNTTLTSATGSCSLTPVSYPDNPGTWTNL